MNTLMVGGQPPQTSNAIQLHHKILELAQDLLIEEMITGNLFACGDGFTSKMAGTYGLYETFNGEVISFQPKPSLNFSLIGDDFVFTGNLATIRVITPRLSSYELSIDKS